jgi:pilus assembly protein CpaB
MGRRTLLLIAAVLLAAIGTSVLFLYVNSFSDRDSDSAQTATAWAPTTTIKAGTQIPENIQLVKVPISREAALNGDFLQDPSKIVGDIANRELLAFQPLSESQFGGAVQLPSRLSLDPGQGYMAVTIEVEDAARNADLLGSGSRVAVWVVDPEVNGGGRQDDRHQARLILPDVEILTIGSTGTIAQNRSAEDGESGAAPTGSSALVTLQVNQEAAGKIMLADAAGEIRLTMLAPDTTPSPETFGDQRIATGP